MKIGLYIAVTTLFLTCLTTSKANEQSLTIAHAIVEKIERAAPTPDMRDAIDLAEGVPPPSPVSDAWIAELKIERVFSGDKSLTGKIMIQNTREEMPAGNSQPITPLLKIGDEGIFVVQRFANGVLGSPAFGQPVLPEGPLPLIKGRDAGFEKALARLSANSASGQANTIMEEHSQPKADSLLRERHKEIANLVQFVEFPSDQAESERSIKARKELSAMDKHELSNYLLEIYSDPALLMPGSHKMTYSIIRIRYLLAMTLIAETPPSKLLPAVRNRFVDLQDDILNSQQNLLVNTNEPNDIVRYLVIYGDDNDIKIIKKCLKKIRSSSSREARLFADSINHNFRTALRDKNRQYEQPSSCILRAVFGMRNTDPDSASHTSYLSITPAKITVTTGLLYGMLMFWLVRKFGAN